MTELFAKGGPIMWPLPVTSIIAVTVVIERLFLSFVRGCGAIRGR
jgi:hypothetical protein